PRWRRTPPGRFVRLRPATPAPGRGRRRRRGRGGCRRCRPRAWPLRSGPRLRPRTPVRRRRARPRVRYARSPGNPPTRGDATKPARGHGRAGISLLPPTGPAGGDVLGRLLDLHLPLGQPLQLLLDLRLVGLLALVLLRVVDCP